MVQKICVRLFWFIAGVITLDLIYDSEDHKQLLAGKEPIHHSTDYHRMYNPEWFLMIEN